MMDQLLVSLAGLSAFALYFSLAVGLLLLFVLLYAALTPQAEWRLIKANNSAAAIAFGGAVLGFAVALASAAVHAVSLLDFALWALIGLVAQLLAFAAVRLLLRGLPGRISAGELASGIILACFALAIGLLNAACMSY